MTPTAKDYASMSPRECLANEIAQALAQNSDRWTAPYGIIVGMTPFGPGKARSVTFGVARTLDATLLIISPKHLRLHASGPLARSCPTEFASGAEFIAWALDPWESGNLKT